MKAIDMIAPRPWSPGEVQQLREDHHRALAPVRSIVADVYNVVVPRITIFADGHVEKEYHFTPEQQSLLDKAEEYRKQIDDDFTRLANRGE